MCTSQKNTNELENSIINNNEIITKQKNGLESTTIQTKSYVENNRIKKSKQKKTLLHKGNRTEMM